MAPKYSIITLALWAICLASCTEVDKAKKETMATDSLPDSKQKEMRSYLSIFEIPATDIARAVDFYQAILNISIEKMDVERMQMGIMPYEGQAVTGVIIKAEGYKPSADGTTVYLNAGEDLQQVLDKVEKNGGKVLVPKTPHADGSGFFAIFLDSEGNKMGLHSPH